MNFGGLGGLGGRAPSFPQRSGAPTSAAVMSDQEWAADWEGRLASVPRTLTVRNEPTQLVAGAEGYDASMAAPYRQQINDIQNSLVTSSRPDADQGALGASMSLAQKSGVVMTPDGRGGFTIGKDPYSGVSSYGGGSHTIAPSVSSFEATNPAYQQLMQQFQDDARMRGESQTRNQQGFDSMAGGNQLNGVIGPDYANANFGSISGQGAAQLPQIDGVDMDWAQGVYDPSQASGLFGNTGKARQTGSWL